MGTTIERLWRQSSGLTEACHSCVHLRFSPNKRTSVAKERIRLKFKKASREGGFLDKVVNKITC